MLIDLQLHSTYSDGYLAPTELADFLLKNSVKVAALTDHNTVGGLDEFRSACKKNKIKAIVGMEIYAKLSHKKFNLLWYNFDDKNPELHKLLRLSQVRRREQIRRALMKLKKLGLIIDENKILDKYSHYIPLNHIIEDICQIADNQEKIAARLGTDNPRVDEIIKHFFANRKVNKLGECYISLNLILTLRKKIGGQIILNHPGKSKQIDNNLIIRLKELGLNGLEVISPHHDISAVMRLQRLAKDLKLIMTGGSDYHLDENAPATIKNVYSYFRVEAKYLAGVNKIIG
ncbi:MAG: PHP domain-containing protein [Patescibacteria group bacterium]|nr:PHP domain-containing protein [Patescibacteria group bacterium]